MSKLEDHINNVLQQLKTEVSAETWISRWRYFNQMKKIADGLGIKEPCQELYDAYIADDRGSKERRSLHIRCVKLLDAAASTNAKNEHGISFNESPMPAIAEVQDFFQGKSFPLPKGICLDHLIVKAEIEMQHLCLSESTMGQYRHAWVDLHRYFIRNRYADYDEPLIQAFLHENDLLRKSGAIKEWKWKINRKAAHVLLEVASTGCFEWGHINRNVQWECAGLNQIRAKYLALLKQRNLRKSTIVLHDYVFRRTMAFARAASQNDLSSLSPEKVQLVISSFSDVCNQRSMATVIPILRSLLAFLFDTGFINRDLSGIVMGAFVQRGSVTPYLSQKDQAELVSCLGNESRRTKAVILLALKLGLRDCDICNLTFHEIDWRNDRILLNQNKTGEPLVLPLLPDIGNALMDYITKERPASSKYPYVFLRAQAPHIKLSSVYPICSNLLQAKNIAPVDGAATGVHLFRYTMVHRLLMAKAPRQVITGILGHTSREADKPYLSMEESMLRMCALDLSVAGRISWEGGSLRG